jgi:hypothetical protein
MYTVYDCCNKQSKTWQLVVYVYSVRLLLQTIKDMTACSICIQCTTVVTNNQRQSYTLYIYYKSSCLWLFVTTVVHCIHILQAVMSVIVCYNSRTLYTYTTSRHVFDCLLQQSYTVYIYYKPSCLWLFVATVVHCIHILEAVMSVIVCYNSRTLYTCTTSYDCCNTQSKTWRLVVHVYSVRLL